VKNKNGEVVKELIWKKENVTLSNLTDTKRNTEGRKGVPKQKPGAVYTSIMKYAGPGEHTKFDECVRKLFTWNGNNVTGYANKKEPATQSAFKEALAAICKLKWDDNRVNSETRKKCSSWWQSQRGNTNGHEFAIQLRNLMKTIGKDLAKKSSSARKPSLRAFKASLFDKWMSDDITKEQMKQMLDEYKASNKQSPDTAAQHSVAHAAAESAAMSALDMNS
jgi:hypothetical protein